MPRSSRQSRYRSLTEGEAHDIILQAIDLEQSFLSCGSSRPQSVAPSPNVFDQHAVLETFGRDVAFPGGRHSAFAGTFGQHKAFSGESLPVMAPPHNVGDWTESRRRAPTTIMGHRMIPMTPLLMRMRRRKLTRQDGPRASSYRTRSADKEEKRPRRNRPTTGNVKDENKHSQTAEVIN